MRRALAETLIEMVEGIPQPTREVLAWPYLRVVSLRVDVPMEVRLGVRDGEWEFFADVPQWRWQTGLEEPRGRLRINWETGGAA